MVSRSRRSVTVEKSSFHTQNLLRRPSLMQESIGRPFMKWEHLGMTLQTAAALLLMVMQSGMLGPYVVQPVRPDAQNTEPAKRVGDCKPIKRYGVSGCELLISAGERRCPSGYSETWVCPSNPMMKSPCYATCVADAKRPPWFHVTVVLDASRLRSYASQPVGLSANHHPM